MKKTIRGKFPDDARDDVLKRGKIVKVERMFPPVLFWQLKLFDRNGMPSENDPRDLAPACTTAFWGGPMRKHIDAMDKKYGRGKYRKARENEERKKK